MTDFRLENHGSIWLLHPMTHRAEEWCDEHLPEDRQTYGSFWALSHIATVIEPRYVADIVDGIRRDGLEV